jgi:hypothetical protein
MRLFSLPKPIVSNLSLMWLNAENLCKLDSANCNKVSRVWFLSVLGDLEIKSSLNSCREHVSANFISWLNARQIKVGCEFRLGKLAMTACVQFNDIPALNYLVKLTLCHAANAEDLFKVLDECFVLEDLSLSNSVCDFSDDIGGNIAACCSELIHVDFSFSKHIGRDFMQLFCQAHEHITSLNVGKCDEFDDICLSMVCKRWHLVSLDVSKREDTDLDLHMQCIINEQTMESLSKQSGLLNLDLSGNKIVKPLVHFEKMLLNNPKLVSLNLNCCFRLIDDVNLRLIGKHCSALEILGFASRPKIDGQLFTGIGVMSIYMGCGQLTSLNMSGHILQLDLALNMLKHLPKLSEIWIANSPSERSQCDVCVLIAGMIFSSVKSLSLNHGLYIHGQQNDNKADELSVEKVISASSFAWNSADGGKSLYSLLPKNNQSLKSLYIVFTETTKMDENLLAYIKSAGTQLTSLRLGFLKFGLFLERLSVCCRKLQTLTLKHCEINDSCVVLMFKHNPGLEHVSLIDCNVTNISLTEGMTLLTGLKSLVLVLSKVTSNAIVAVLRNTVLLRELELCCNKVSPGMKSVTSAIEKLLYLEKVQWDERVNKFRFSVQ